MKAITSKTALILFISSMALSGQAQKESIDIGVKIGGQSSDAIGHGVNLGLDFLKPQSIFTPGISLYADIPIGGGFYISPEAAYRQKGFKISGQTQLPVFELPVPVGAEMVTRINYLDASTNLKYKFGNEKISGFVRGGPYLGYATSGKVDFRLNSLIDIKLASVDINPHGNLYERFEYGAVAGAGFEVRAGSGKFITEITYQRAFNDFTNVPVIDAGLKNQSFGFNIGFAIPIGGKSVKSIGS